MAKPVEVFIQMAEKEGKYLTFSLADQEYGWHPEDQGNHRDDAHYSSTPNPGIREGCDQPSREVIPVVDLRLRFDMEATGVDRSDLHCGGGTSERRRPVDDRRGGGLCLGSLEHQE